MSWVQYICSSTIEDIKDDQDSHAQPSKRAPFNNEVILQNSIFYILINILNTVAHTVLLFALKLSKKYVHPQTNVL